MDVILMKKMTFGVTLLITCFSAWSAGEVGVSRYPQKTLLKNWALSRCLAEVYSDEGTKADANATASAYFEFGVLPVEAYDGVRALISTFSKRKYGGSIKSEFNTMKCIDLFHSNDLDLLATELLEAPFLKR